MKTSAIFAVAFAALSQLPAALAAPDTTKVLKDPPSKIIAREDTPTQVPSTAPVFDALKSQGCYEYAGNNYTKISVQDLSTGSCGDACTEKKYTVSALYGGACFCGMFYPPEGSMVKDKNCNYPCPTYPKEACGSLGSPHYWSIFNTGIDVNVEPMPKEKKEDDEDKDKDKDEDKKKPAETSSAAATSTAGSSAPSATETQGNDDGGDKKDEKKTNTAGIAAGVVVGVAVIAGGIGGLFFWMRRRRNHELEEDHRRNAAVNAFINGSKPPSSHGSISMTDSRMDPVLANRRLSDGSIADNQDYSRRILRVTNA